MLSEQVIWVVSLQHPNPLWFSQPFGLVDRNDLRAPDIMSTLPTYQHLFENRIYQPWGGSAPSTMPDWVMGSPQGSVVAAVSAGRMRGWGMLKFPPIQSRLDYLEKLPPLFGVCLQLVPHAQSLCPSRWIRELWWVWEEKGGVMLRTGAVGSTAQSVILGGNWGSHIHISPALKKEKKKPKSEALGRIFPLAKFSSAQQKHLQKCLDNEQMNSL